MTHKIVLVDDDQNILTSVKMAMEAVGFSVSIYHDGEQALAGLRSDMPDLGVFDVKMPRMDGMELLRAVRDFSDMPVIFLTSVDDEVDQIAGLRLGADDYITKPFSQKLLIERIRVLLRRSDLEKQGARVKENLPEKIKRGRLTLDDARYMCVWDKQPVALTVTEYLLLKSLAVKPGHVKTRDQLIDEAYGDSVFMDDRTIDSHIKRLRQKFKKIDFGFDKIQSVYGAGYKYKER